MAMHMTAKKKLRTISDAESETQQTETTLFRTANQRISFLLAHAGEASKRIMTGILKVLYNIYKMRNVIVRCSAMKTSLYSLISHIDSTCIILLHIELVYMIV